MVTTETSSPESGHVAVFAMVGLLILFLGVALIAQVGLCTFRARHAQAVADISAMSGAVTQAATMNKLARHNRQIVTAYEELKWVLATTVFPNRSAALAYIKSYEVRQRIQKEMMDEANTTGAKDAMRNAMVTCFMNTNGSGTFRYLGTEDLARSVLPDTFTHWEYRWVIYKYIEMIGGVPVVVYDTKRVMTWMVKDPPLITAFAAGTILPMAKALHGEALFTAVPEMKTGAQAKPYAGRIYEPDDSYMAKLIALDTPHAPFERRYGKEAKNYEH